MSFKEILLPDVTTFGELLEYHGEWSYLRGWTSPVGPRFWPERTPENASSWERSSWRSNGRNTVGPFCTVDLSQLGGKTHRSMAVRATDAVLEAVAGRIVTPDDNLSFKLIGHRSDGKVLVILEHSYIIGSHWLAEIDPESIPSYPFTARDEAFERICTAIVNSGRSEVPYVGDLPDHGKYVHPMKNTGLYRQPDRTRRAEINKDGRVELTWPEINTHTGKPWTSITEAPGTKESSS